MISKIERYFFVGFWLVIFWFSLAFPLYAAVERVPLTIISLQEKLNAPVLKEGVQTIDLSSTIIDLQDENKDFREQFYQLLQGQLNRAKQPLSLDFSNSQILGAFNASRIGLPTPLTKVAISPLLSPVEQQLLQRDERFLDNLGEPVTKVTVFRGMVKLNDAVFTGAVDFSRAFFLQSFEAVGTKFADSNWLEGRFVRGADFSRAIFGGETAFGESLFVNNSRFRLAQFKGVADFRRAHFDGDGDFDRSRFDSLADFTRSLWLKSAFFTQIQWHDRVIFSKSRFLSLLTLRNSTFEKASAFRSCYFQGNVSFQDVKLLEQVDFSNSTFTNNSFIAVSGLAFDSDKAKILGDRGIIGKVIYLPTIDGNETILRNLVRNFRYLEQIEDANQIEYKIQRLRFQQLKRKLVNVSKERLLKLSWLGDFLKISYLALLLLISQYGTNFNLVIGTGTIIFAYFGFLFWLIDRFRRLTPKPIVPNKYEITCMIGSYLTLTFLGIINIVGSSSRPLLTLSAIAFFLIPLPVTLVIALYQRGRYHDLMDSSYFIQDGSFRQLRLLITRLPVVPEFPLFRDRYKPVPWERRWNWLNYYDLSLNNLLKIGFNDWRTRDRELPGIIAFLVWYQWALGIFYITLLIWTLSRTIPGLNLLIYLR